MSESTIRERLAFNAIDQETMATLHEWKSFILSALPPILDGFYDHVAKFRETSAFFKRDAAIAGRQRPG